MHVWHAGFQEHSMWIQRGCFFNSGLVSQNGLEILTRFGFWAPSPEGSGRAVRVGPSWVRFLEDFDGFGFLFSVCRCILSVFFFFIRKCIALHEIWTNRLGKSKNERKIRYRM